MTNFTIEAESVLDMAHKLIDELSKAEITYLRDVLGIAEHVLDKAPKPMSGVLLPPILSTVGKASAEMHNVAHTVENDVAQAVSVVEKKL